MARIHAYRILNQYFEDESFLNIALNEELKKSELKREDKDLCTTIVYGTIQNLLAIQYQLQPYIKGKRVKKKIKTLLYLSLYQQKFSLLFVFYIVFICFLTLFFNLVL